MAAFHTGWVGGKPPMTEDIEGRNWATSQWVKVALSKFQMRAETRQKARAVRGSRTAAPASTEILAGGVNIHG